MSLSDSVGRAARVVPFPERKFKPNTASCFAFVNTANGHPGKLFEMAHGALAIAEKLKGDADKSGKPNDFQHVVDVIGIAFFALGTMLGIPQGTVESCAFGDEPVVKPPQRRAKPLGELNAKLKQRKKTIRRLHKRALTLLRHRDAAEVPYARRLLTAIVEHGDVIALPVDSAKRRGRPDVHILLSLPAYLADDLATFTGRFEDDEDTDGGEDQQDAEPDDDEFSLGNPDAIVDQSRIFSGTIMVGEQWQSTGGDLELDNADFEPSLGSSDPSPSAGSPGYVAFADQTHWADGDRRDREVEEDGEDDQDLEPGLRDAPKSLDDPRMSYHHAIRRPMEPVEREAAKERQSASLKRGEQRPVPESFRNGGETRDKCLSIPASARVVMALSGGSEMDPPEPSRPLSWPLKIAPVADLAPIGARLEGARVGKVSTPSNEGKTRDKIGAFAGNAPIGALLDTAPIGAVSKVGKPNSANLPNSGAVAEIAPIGTFLLSPPIGGVSERGLAVNPRFPQYRCTGKNADGLLEMRGPEGETFVWRPLGAKP